MEFLGRESADVVSVACSSSSRTSFATLSGHGTLTLWDLRLKRKNYLSIDNQNTTSRTEASELRYFPDHHTAVALCGNTVQLYDTRKSLFVVAEHVHTKECVAFLRAAPPPDAEATLLIDEDGGMFPFSLTDGTKKDVLEEYMLGRRCAMPVDQEVFGHLDNYCSGLHCMNVGGDSEDSGEPSRVLFAVGMDGNGALYTVEDEKNDINDSKPITRIPFCIMEAPHDEKRVQMVNPPLVNCTAVCRSTLVVGRADGTYTVYDVENGGPVAVLEAPGHAVNGLCYVDWFSPDVLLTTSLCGDVTGWNVGSFLAAEDNEDEEREKGDLPEVVAAFSHREVPGCQLATVNCGDRLDENSYVFGDHMGGVTLARIEL